MNPRHSKLLLALVLAASIPQSGSAEVISVQARGECWQDDYTFESTKISKERFEQLLPLSPNRGIELRGDNWLEACMIRNCPASVHEEAFFENAEENQKAIKARMDSLKALKAPAELTPIVDFYLQQNSFQHWVNSIRLRFYRTWKADSLAARYFIKPAKKSIDAGVLCRDLIDSLAREKNRDKQYLATQGGLNCANTEFQKSVSYSKDAWNAFLKAYDIQWKHTGGGACD